MIDKAALRKRMRMVRDMVDDHLMRSVQLWAKVAELDEYRQANSVMAFVGFSGEPDTDPLFARLNVEGKRLLLPRVEPSGLVAVEGDSPMSVSKFGVSEPIGPPVDLEEIDFIIVPGLAFTTAGDRLGYGQGYYDRFLPTVSAPSAGVCFVDQLVDEMPLAAHDVRVDMVICS
ncbi:MAG TPA: 5-formyltetrahydrofolate cyclo-ligase [Ilumatobacteraceae bacterium]|nr:5-formyltetrahydrofolate cyclo-ligase [Ilumatobacteraceae bacterium]